MDANNSAGSDLVVAKEEERSVSTVQQSLNGKRKDLSIKSNVHLLQEDVDGNKKFLLLRVPTPDYASSTGSKNGHPVYEQKIRGTTLYWCDTCRYWTASHSTGGHDDNYKHNKGKKEKDGTTTDPTSNYASGITFDPSVWLCKISEQQCHQEELHAPININDL
jgi:hypothetical protein